MVVNSYKVLYMYVEVIICQSDKSTERKMISQTPCIGGTSNQFKWENEWEENSPSFWGKFCKILPSQNRIFLTFQNCGRLDLSHFCICQYYSYGTKVGPVDLSSDVPPGRGIQQPRTVLSWVWLTWAQMCPPSRDISWPRVVQSWVQLTWSQTYTPVEASSDQEWY